MTLQKIVWRIVAKWVLLTWYPVRDATPEYLGLIATAADKARQIRRAKR